MRDDFREGDWNAHCYICGRKRKASQLVKHWQGFYVCPEHPGRTRHPQELLRGAPIERPVPWVQRFDDQPSLDGIITEDSDEYINGYEYIATEDPIILIAEVMEPDLTPLLYELLAENGSVLSTENEFNLLYEN